MEFNEFHEQEEFFVQNFIQLDLMPYFLASDSVKVGKHGFPQLEKENFIPETPVLPFNYLPAAMNRPPCWYHCFIADVQFNRLYRYIWRYTNILRYIKGLISTDFSLFRDYDEESQIENCRKNRVMDYALQKFGVPIIPTAGFASESSFDWCFDGLPLNSTVAVTTNCIGNDPEAKRLFVWGIAAMIEKIYPTAIVVCGKCPSWLFENYPEIKIIQIPSYSQLWKERRAA